jgi:hypothetical protein
MDENSTLLQALEQITAEKYRQCSHELHNKWTRTPPYCKLWSRSQQNKTGSADTNPIINGRGLHNIASSGADNSRKKTGSAATNSILNVRELHLIASSGADHSKAKTHTQIHTHKHTHTHYHRVG